MNAKTNVELLEVVTALQARVEALETKLNELTTTPVKAEGREMTDEDARSVLSGELKELKHKDAAAKLGLSYGQIYSCRLGFTFKTIHKEMKTNGIVNPWIK